MKGNNELPRRQKRTPKIWLILIPATSVAGCGGNITVHEAQAAVPLFHQIDARVAKSFAAEARFAEVDEVLARADIGRISVGRFDQAFDAMFTETAKVADWPPWQRADLSQIDGVIQLEDAEADIALGTDLDVPDVVRVSYRVCLYNNDVTTIQCWDSSASQEHQRVPFECLPDLTKCVGRQLEIAVRDAVAKLMVQVEADPAVKSWADHLPERGSGP